MEKEQEFQSKPELVKRPHFLSKEEYWEPFTVDTGFHEGKAVRIGEVVVDDELEATDID